MTAQASPGSANRWQVPLPVLDEQEDPSPQGALGEHNPPVTPGPMQRPSVQRGSGSAQRLPDAQTATLVEHCAPSGKVRRQIELPQLSPLSHCGAPVRHRAPFVLPSAAHTPSDSPSANTHPAPGPHWRSKLSQAPPSSTAGNSVTRRV